MLRKRCGICEELQTVSVLLDLRSSATTPRVSIEAGASPWLTRRVLTMIPPSAFVCSKTLSISSVGGCIPKATFVFFFFQAEDGIRDLTVTGVQTCALPI